MIIHTMSAKPFHEGNCEKIPDKVTGKGGGAFHEEIARGQDTKGEIAQRLSAKGLHKAIPQVHSTKGLHICHLKRPFHKGFPQRVYIRPFHERIYREKSMKAFARRPFQEDNAQRDCVKVVSRRQSTKGFHEKQFHRKTKMKGSHKSESTKRGFDPK